MKGVKWWHCLRQDVRYFRFFSFWGGFQDAGWVPGLAGVGIHVTSHLDVYDTLHPVVGPEASKEDVSVLLLAYCCWLGWLLGNVLHFQYHDHHDLILLRG
jgi:hypothetical protein